MNLDKNSVTEPDKNAKRKPDLRTEIEWTLHYDGEPIPAAAPLHSFEDRVDLLSSINYGIRRLQNNLVDLMEYRDTIRQQARLLSYSPQDGEAVQ